MFRIRQGIAMAIEHQRINNLAENKVKTLREDILNVPIHAFGDHKRPSYFCIGKNEEMQTVKNYIPALKSSGLLYKIMEAVNNIADNARSLTYDCSNNSVESYNSVRAKFVGGKRVNFCLRRSYLARCHAAILSMNHVSPVYALNKSMFDKSPEKYCKRWQKKPDHLIE